MFVFCFMKTRPALITACMNEFFWFGSSGGLKQSLDRKCSFPPQAESNYLFVSLYVHDVISLICLFLSHEPREALSAGLSVLSTLWSSVRYCDEDWPD